MDLSDFISNLVTLSTQFLLIILKNKNHIVILIQSNIMNTFEIKYQGKLRTTATHLDSGSEISTDAPKDNHGLGETFSPTDLVCSALASCILTIMAIAVEKNDVDIKDTRATVKKTMGTNPRRIVKIDIDLIFPKEYDSKTKTTLERAAQNCPVHHTLSEKVEKNISFTYFS
jgi:putative redox protein